MPMLKLSDGASPAADGDFRGFPADWTWLPPPLGVALLGPPRSGGFAGALLLDRDGVLIRDRGYLARPEQVELVESALAAMELARRHGWAVALITNQGGIGRQLFGWSELAAVHAQLSRQLAEHGLAIDLAIASPYHPNGSHPVFGRNGGSGFARKPDPGMLRLAVRLLALPEDCPLVFVGDKASDLEAAKRFGACRGLRVSPAATPAGAATWQPVLRAMALEDRDDAR